MPDQKPDYSDPQVRQKIVDDAMKAGRSAHRSLLFGHVALWYVGAVITMLVLGSAIARWLGH